MTTTTGSVVVVYTAIAGNVGVAVSKFVAAAFTGSSAMFSEGIHSLVDSANGLLVLLGIRRSRALPDAAHPFGSGKELYFWTLIVAILIFAIGGGISIYGGIIRVLDPQPLRDLYWSYGVIAMAALIEGGPGWSHIASFAARWATTGTDARSSAAKTRPPPRCCSKTAPR
jgi:divalent metal cation (Fe/Co/Zn/Cd) transporter